MIWYVGTLPHTDSLYTAVEKFLLNEKVIRRLKKLYIPMLFLIAIGDKFSDYSENVANGCKRNYQNSLNTVLTHHRFSNQLILSTMGRRRFCGVKYIYYRVQITGD